MTRITTVVVSLVGYSLSAPSEAFAANSPEVVPILGGTSAAVAMRMSGTACHQAHHHRLSLSLGAYTLQEGEPLILHNCAASPPIHAPAWARHEPPFA